MLNLISDEQHAATNRMLRDMCIQSKESGLLAESYKAAVFDVLWRESLYHTALKNLNVTNDRVGTLYRGYEDSIEYRLDVIGSFAF